MTREKGVLLAVKVLLVLGGIAVCLWKVTPSGRSVTDAQEGAALDSLTRIAIAQERFQGLRRMDADGDGKGEYGSLSELLGPSDPPAGKGNPPREPALLEWGRGSSVREDGVHVVGAYCIRVFLPGPRGTAAWGRIAGLGPDAGIDIDGAERRWWAIAWPARGTAGRQYVYYRDAGGNRLVTRDPARRYATGREVPAWNAAFTPESVGRTDPTLAVGVPGCDGNLWKRLP